MSLKQIRSVLETMYDGTATVYGLTYTTGAHGAEEKTETALFTDIPCRLSYDRKTHDDQDTHSRIEQEITMFCDPGYDIPPGSKIEITQYGRTRTYQCGSQAAVYQSHQEIELTSFRKRA